MQKIEKFETVLNAEFDVRQAQAAVRMKKEGMLQTATTLQVLEAELEAAYGTMDTARGALAPGEGRAYGEYRKVAAAEYGWRW